MAKDKFHWFKFEPGVWLQDPELSRWSAAARGVWIDILCLMFQSDERGVLVSCGEAWTVEETARALRGDNEVSLSSIQELLRRGVMRSRKDGALYCSRMVRETELSKVRAEAGQIGGLAKAKQNASKPPSKPLTVTLSSQSNSSKKEKKVQEEQAHTLYAMYPRHVGKKAALVKIRIALQEVGYEVLEAAVKRFAQSRQGEEPKYTPYPATWFNRGSWEDEPDKPGTAGNPFFQGDRR